VRTRPLPHSLPTHLLPGTDPCAALAAAGQDYRLVRTRIDELNQATMHLAELTMNRVLSKTLEGKSLDDV